MMCSSPARPDVAAEPKYKGVRKRKWGKWVSEIRLPNSRERIWLGSYDTPEKAARAFDAAQFCLRGCSARFNFPDDPPDILGGQTLKPAEIQLAACRYANLLTEPSLHQQQQQQQPREAEGVVVGLTHTAEGRRGEGEGEEKMSSSSYSLSSSEGATVQMDNKSTFDGSYSFSDPYLDPLNSMGSGSYASDYGLISTFDDYSRGSESLNFDYGGEEENCYGSFFEGSFLWNFER